MCFKSNKEREREREIKCHQIRGRRRQTWKGRVACTRNHLKHMERSHHHHCSLFFLFLFYFSLFLFTVIYSHKKGKKKEYSRRCEDESIIKLLRFVKVLNEDSFEYYPIRKYSSPLFLKDLLHCISRVTFLPDQFPDKAVKIEKRLTELFNAALVKKILSEMNYSFNFFFSFSFCFDIFFFLISCVVFGEVFLAESTTFNFISFTLTITIITSLRHRCSSTY